jgi:hypothetical protein
MRSCRWFLVLLVMLLTQSETSRPEAQSFRIPGLSGTWTLIEPADPPAYSPFGREFTVTQAANSVTFTWAGGTLTSTLDGSHAPRAITTASGETWIRNAYATFVSNALVVTISTQRATGSWEDLVVVSLGSSNTLSLVSVASLKSVEPVMGTRVLKYSRATPE